MLLFSSYYFIVLLPPSSVQLLIESLLNFYGTVGHNPSTNRLDFCGNPDPDPGMF